MAAPARGGPPPRPAGEPLPRALTRSPEWGVHRRERGHPARVLAGRERPWTCRGLEARAPGKTRVPGRPREEPGSTAGMRTPRGVRPPGEPLPGSAGAPPPHGSSAPPRWGRGPASCSRDAPCSAETAKRKSRASRRSSRSRRSRPRGPPTPAPGSAASGWSSPPPSTPAGSTSRTPAGGSPPTTPRAAARCGAPTPTPTSPAGSGPAQASSLPAPRTARWSPCGRGTGRFAWRTQLTSEVLSRPRAAGDRVVARTLDGKLFGLDAGSGEVLWSYDGGVPSLIVRGTGSPAVVAGVTIAGFDNGRVTAVRSATGEVLWEAAVSDPRGVSEIERLTDVDTEPVVEGGAVYAASYERAVAAFEAETGRTLWRRPIASRSGLAADADLLYVADTRGAVHALDRASGATRWTQESLAGRGPAWPAVHGPFVAVTDSEGYVHWLRREDGRPAARTRSGAGRIAALPPTTATRSSPTGEGGGSPRSGCASPRAGGLPPCFPSLPSWGGPTSGSPPCSTSSPAPGTPSSPTVPASPATAATGPPAATAAGSSSWTPGGSAAARKTLPPRSGTRSGARSTKRTGSCS